MRAHTNRKAALIFALSAAVFVAVLGPQRATSTTPDAHFVHLANSYLHGQLNVLGERPPTFNDWALFDGKWYVSFPPFPALLILPAVAVFGLEVWDRLFWALFAGLGPALLYLVLERLHVLGRSARSPREHFGLSLLFAFGTVYFFSAVQGSVWFAAHIVACVLSCVYLLAVLGLRAPALAGLCLGALFMTRPTTLLLGGVFVGELLFAEAPGAPAQGLLPRVRAALRPPALGAWARFALPALAVGMVALMLNQLRFDDPLSFGHEHLQIRWRGRIDRYGLFAYHYLGRNLAIFLASLPWLLDQAPHVMVSRHGLALWVTTPGLFWLLWPRTVTPQLWVLSLCAGAVALLDLTYQNSGWVQFGYRFALDYMVLLFAMLAMGGRRLGPGFWLLAVVAVGINLFGAITFDRMPQFYDRDPSQRVLVQPD